MLFQVKKSHGAETPRMTVCKSWLLYINYLTNIDLPPLDKYFPILYDRFNCVTIEEYFDALQDHQQLDIWAHFYYYDRKSVCFVF